MKDEDDIKNFEKYRSELNLLIKDQREKYENCICGDVTIDDLFESIKSVKTNIGNNERFTTKEDRDSFERIFINLADIRTKWKESHQIQLGGESEHKEHNNFLWSARDFRDRVEDYEKTLSDSHSKPTTLSSTNYGERLNRTTESMKTSTLTDVPEQRDYILQKVEKTEEEMRAKKLLNPETTFDVKYLGGHKAFPTKKEQDARIGIFIDRIEVDSDKFHQIIFYEHMTNIENMDEKKISHLRVAGLAFVFFPLAIAGLLKKRKVYTVIEYNDGINTQTLVFDFGRYLVEIQQIIYQKMIAARTKREN